MANNIIRRKWNQNALVSIEDLSGSVFQAESGGHTFEISGVDNYGNTVALSGTVAGVFMRSDNTDVAITGTASGGIVTVTLPAECYDVPGRFGLTVFVTADSKKTAVYAAIGTVRRTSSGSVAPGTTADVVDLINAINAAVATIPQSWSGLMADIAPTYSASAVYPVGAYVYYDGDLYRCTTAITTAESWTAAHWTAAVLGNDVSELKSAINQIIPHEPDNMADRAYSVGQYFIYDYTGSLCRVTSAIAIGDTIASGVNITIVQYTSIMEFLLNLMISGDSTLSTVITTLIGQIVPHETSTTVTHNYSAGDYFIYDFSNTLYQAQTTIASGTAFVSGSTAKVVTASGALNALRAYADANVAKMQSSVDIVNENLVGIPYLRPYNSDNITIKHYIQSDGSEHSQNGWNITDYLPITGIVTYSGITTTSANVYAAYYQSNKTLISTFNPAKNTNRLNAPSNAAYVRFSIVNADLSSFDYVCQLTPAFDDLEPFQDVIALPDDIYLYAGIQTNIYRDSLFVPDGAKNNIQSTNGLNYAECWRFQPNSSITDDGTITVQRYDAKYTNILAQKSATLHYGSAAHNAGTIKCLFIGDSTTEQGRYLYPLLNNFSGDSTVIESIGTRPTLNYPAIYCEGRSGWRLLDYVTYASLSTVTNAFWNPSTSEFDFSYYMAQNQSGVTLNYVFILLGINDVVKLNATSVDAVKAAAATFCTNLSTVVSSIKDYDSNIKVVFGLITAPAKSQDAWYAKDANGFHYRDQFKRNIVLFNQAIIDGMRENNGVYLIDTNLCIDTEHNMETETVQVNSRNTTQVVRQNNLVHYPIEGGAQVADRIFAFIKNV